MDKLLGISAAVVRGLTRDGTVFEAKSYATARRYVCTFYGTVCVECSEHVVWSTQKCGELVVKVAAHRDVLDFASAAEACDLFSVRHCLDYRMGRGGVELNVTVVPTTIQQCLACEYETCRLRDGGGGGVSRRSRDLDATQTAAKQMTQLTYLK